LSWDKDIGRLAEILPQIVLLVRLKGQTFLALAFQYGELLTFCCDLGGFYLLFVGLWACRLKWIPERAQ
jgi:hypothetical protein